MIASMALSSASTDAQVLAAYEDNASYDVDNDPAAARSFIRACRIILLRVAGRSGTGGGQFVEMNTEEINGQLKDAREWLRTNGGGVSGSASKRRLRFAGFGGYRS